MALGIVRTKDIVARAASLEGIKLRVVTLTGDATYAVGGYALTPANVGFDTTILAVIPCGFGVAGTYSVAWDAVNQKLKWCRMGAALSLGFAEAGVNEAGVNTTVVTCLVLGY